MDTNGNNYSALFITRLREQVDRLDDRLLALLHQRIGIARELGRLKRQAGLPLRDHTREDVLLARLTAAGNSELPPETIRHLFRCIIETAIAIEEADAKK